MHAAPELRSPKYSTIVILNGPHAIYRSYSFQGWLPKVWYIIYPDTLYCFDFNIVYYVRYSPLAYTCIFEQKSEAVTEQVRAWPDCQKKQSLALLQLESIGQLTTLSLQFVFFANGVGFLKKAVLYLQENVGHT